ncbi:flavin reductase family protein [bacterium]|nr:flavin reductase family protein [bacterium]
MSEYKTITPGTIPVPELHGYLLGSINPRPIAFVATLDENGNPNLAPFSFFNVFGANPPIIVFSPARRGKNNTTKDTFENIKLSKECTVNIVNYAMTHQMVLASTDYPQEVDEFKKAGFTPIKSDLVKAPRVAESPSQMECKVREIINYGDLPGGGNLIIAEVVKMHVKTDVLGEDGKIDAHKIDTVGRCGKLWYTRSNDGLFEIENPRGHDNIGFDKMPERIKHSKVLTGNDLGQLGKAPELPKKDEITAYIKEHAELKSLLNEGDIEQRLHTLAKKHIAGGDIDSAWKVLMANKV